MQQAAKDSGKEGEKTLQNWFTKAIAAVFEGCLHFEDTHRTENIIKKCRPDLTVVFPDHYASRFSALAFIELKVHSIDGAACGQVINVVNRVSNSLPDNQKREIWGFGMNVSDQNFVYCHLANGGILVFFNALNSLFPSQIFIF